MVLNQVSISISIRKMKVCIRSDYFKTALSTGVGNQDKVIEVKECSPLVLTTVIDFMYEISLPEDLSCDDAKSLLTMADLYLMEDLKDAVAPILAKHLSKDNTLETTKMAEKYTAQKLMDFCCDFIQANIGDLDDNNVLDELFFVMPMVAKSCFQKQQNKIEKIDVFNKAFGINLTVGFKKRNDFKSDLEYKEYMTNHMKPKMLVLCNKTCSWKSPATGRLREVKEGTVGRFIRFDVNEPLIKWSTPSYLDPMVGAFLDLDLFANPIKIDWLTSPN